MNRFKKFFYSFSPFFLNAISLYFVFVLSFEGFRVEGKAKIILIFYHVCIRVPSLMIEIEKNNILSLQTTITTAISAYPKNAFAGQIVS